jgi:hypothetical protein
VCYKNEFLIKTAFSIFSFMAAISAFILTFFLAISMEYFIDKMLSAFLYMNYYIFGLYMLGFSIFGLVHWNDITYVCDKNFLFHKEFSLSNMFSLLGCFILSLTITIGVCIYETVMLYIDTILRREGGNKYLRSLFWWAVFRGRGAEVLRGNGNGNGNGNAEHIDAPAHPQAENDHQNPNIDPNGQNVNLPNENAADTNNQNVIEIHNHQ